MTDISPLIALFDAAEDTLSDALRAAGWIESEDGDRWLSPDRKLRLPLAAAWERARRDAVTAWRRA